MDRETLTSYIQEAPEGSGVYIFRDGERVLYVGKAIDIQERLRSYLDPRTPRIRRMVERADHIETECTRDERKALLSEANLIKRYRPRYNTRLKDGKTYPVIELTEHEFPQIRMSRDPDADSMVFGPFTSVGEVETGIKAFRDLYGVRACSDRTVENRDRPCVPYQMGLCSAPCAGLISQEEYADRVKKVSGFFEDKDPVIRELTRRMEEAADEQRYERAATLKEYREALTALTEGKDRRDGETHAVVVGPEGERIGRVIMERNGISEKEKHALVGEGVGSDTDAKKAVSAFIEQFYSRAELPQRLVTEEVPEDGMLLRWLESESTEIEEPKNGTDRVLLRAARSAASTESSGDATRSLEDALDRDIQRIEGFDVSHTGGKETVGSNVTFERDTPEKGGYRRKTLQGNDDYRNMRDLLRWRGERAREGRDRRPDPDVILIDGGKKQVEAAIEGMEEAGWGDSVAVLGMVKPEDRVVGSVTDPDVSEKAERLLAYVRDEAHRFAKKSHTQRRDSVQSQIQQIEGIGPSLAGRILSEFSTEELKDLDSETIQRVQGVGPETAERILEDIDGLATHR